MDTQRENFNRFQQLLQEKGIELSFLVPSPNFFYLTGIEMEPLERLTAIIVPAKGDPSIVCPSFEEARLRKLTWIDNFLPWEEDDDPYNLVSSEIKDTPSEKLGIDGSVSFEICMRLKKLGINLMTAKPISDLLGRLRIHKTNTELNLMRKASEIISKAIQTGHNNISVGMSEMELRSIIEQTIYSNGGIPNHVLVQFGKNSSYPHQDTTNNTCKQNDVVLIDIVAKYEGYCSDVTRMAVFGPASKEQKQLYAVLQKSQRAAREFTKIGVLTSEIDRVARNSMDKGPEKYSQYFIHRLGHGIGIEAHEPPYIVAGAQILLEHGNTHTIEPGLYFEGKFGFRIEDTVAIATEGVDVLTNQLIRELIEI